MLGQEDKSRELWEKSLALLNTMTERERLRTLGIYYMTVTRNIDKAIETYQTLIEKFPADAAGHNNLAVAYFSNVQLVQARDAGQRILDIYPSSLLYLCNFALYNMYVADMGPAVEYADRTLERDPNYFVAYLPLIMQQLLNIDYQGAERIYQEMAETGVHGLSIAQLGRADIAMARGDYRSAITILSESIANDDLNANTNNAAIKRLWLARSQVLMGQVEDARLTMESLLDLPPADRHEYERAELHILLGDYDPAIAAADRLSAKIPNGSRALANIIRANVALAQHDHQRAIDFLYKSLTLRDNWLAHYQLGKAYLASDTHVVEAMDEFQSAWSRRGEALAVFLDDLPSYHRLVDVQYWLARTQEDIGMIESATQNYRFFAQRRDRSIADSMIEDATNRLTELTAAAAD
ncbi:MAG: tetratricopeptide repeat protein [Gammaproteobacteria bacterium]|nr:tetratricopeptide repeat protein [Gammaproteobacteria bacterium]